jgi:branched-chain amino acid transport system substrate-binding protein
MRFGIFEAQLLMQMSHKKKGMPTPQSKKGRGMKLNACFLVACSAMSAIGLSLTSPVHAKDILIGQSLDLSGGAAEASKQFMQAAQCHFQEINKSGGIRGNTIKLLSLDDGGKTDKTLANAKQLVETDKVTALFGFSSAAGAQASFPLLEQTGTPLIGVASGGLGIRDKFRREVFHVRASYIVEMEKAIDAVRMVGMMSGKGVVAFVYNQDAKANAKAFEEVAKRKDIKVAAMVGIDRNSTDMQAPAEEIVKSNPAAVIAITTAKAMGALIKSLRQNKYNGAIVSSSFAGDAVIKEAGTAGAGTIVAHIVPNPKKPTTAVTVAFQNLLKRCGATTEASSAAGLEGYVSAVVLVEGLRKAGNDISRTSVINGLESIKSLDLGGMKVGYSGTDHEGSDYVEFLIISKSGQLLQ